MNYITIIKYAIIFFPFIALIFTLPFILTQYHKYGSISLLKSIIIYSFIFYLLSAYFLVILPLPKINDVKLMTTPRTQLIPFKFIIDFIKNTSFSINNVETYIKALKESYFYIPVFNIFLTLPFGVYLRYYSKFNLKKTVIFSFLLSLFFELTQLSGLYFIYPRGYRLFDVDDLILNTLGGLIGYFMFAPLKKIIPEIEEINAKAKEKGKTISGLRRSISCLLDLFIVLFLYSIMKSINIDYKIILTIIYYFIIPIFLNNSTLGQKFLNIQILDYKEEKNILRLILRKIYFTLIYIIIPTIIIQLIFISNIYLKELIGIIALISYFIFYLFVFIKFTFTKKEMLYEKLSKTKMISTIK